MKPDDEDYTVYGPTASPHVPKLEGGLGGGPIGSPGSEAGHRETGPTAGDAAPDLGVTGRGSSATGRAEREEYVEDQVPIALGSPTGPDASMQTPGGISEGTQRDAAGILGTNPHAEDMPDEGDRQEDQAA